MAAWSPQKISSFRAAFLDFLEHIEIDSKETGRARIKLYRSQIRLLDEVLEGLSRGVHYFVCCKSRQLGISTVSYLLTIFYASLHEALKGCIVFDTDGNKTDFRDLIGSSLTSLPESHKIDQTDNRSRMLFANGSTLTYLVAGTRKTKSSGGLGRGRGFNFCHSTETSSYGDMEGMRALTESLAQTFENRFFLIESTARGFNLFHELWEEAIEDTFTKKAIFIGWWAHDLNIIAEDDPRYAKYITGDLTEDEEYRYGEVEKRYGWKITPEQIAWHRWKTDPGRKKDESEEAESANDIIEQEQPTLPEDAFLLSGSTYFPTRKLTVAVAESRDRKFQSYRYHFGDDFFGTVREECRARDAQLRIWEEPDSGATYGIGADPAFGSSDTADRYCAQIFRYYADGLDQVGEFCTTDLEPHEFAWVLADLCGWFRNARFLLEMNGPGAAVWKEFRTLKRNIENGLYTGRTMEKDGIIPVFNNIRTYIWTKYDTIAGQTNAYHWKMHSGNKFEIMTQYKMAFIQGQVRLCSRELLLEMQKVIQKGSTVSAEGKNKDDRVIAAALATRAWNDSERSKLITFGQTRDKQLNKTEMSEEDLRRAFGQRIFRETIAGAQAQRRRASYAAKRGHRWGW